jgi:hypothetical protein
MHYDLMGCCILDFIPRIGMDVAARIEKNQILAGFVCAACDLSGRVRASSPVTSVYRSTLKYINACRTVSGIKLQTQYLTLVIRLHTG